MFILIAVNFTEDLARVSMYREKKENLIDK